MTYPNSAAVVAGQATEAAQYNNLRMDAVFLGGDPAASGTLWDLLYMSIGQISLQQNGAAGIILTANNTEPAAVMIDGLIYRVTNTLSYTMSAEYFPAAGYYSIYAAAAAAGAFTLGVGTNIPSHARKIGGFIWTGSFIIRGTLRTVSEEAISAGKNPFVCSGRLTLASATPIPDEDITNAETLYFTPYGGNEISLYLGGQWVVFNFSEISMRLSGLQREIPYDIFLTVTSSGFELVSQIWGSASVRSVGFVMQDGIPVSSADRSRRYLGTICLNSAGYGEDTKTGRLVWNEYNRVMRPILAPLVTSKTIGAVHMNVWAPYFDEDAPVVRILAPKVDCDFELLGVGKTEAISENDRSYQRAAAIGILQDPMTEAPYTNNACCAEVFGATYGNGPDVLRIGNTGSKFLGYHQYYLGYWSNYSFRPSGVQFKSSSGENPGLYGKIFA